MSPWKRTLLFMCVPLVGCASSGDEVPDPESPQGGSSAAGSGSQSLGGTGGATAGSGPAGGRAGSAPSGGKSGGSGGSSGTGGTLNAGAAGLGGRSGSGGMAAGGDSGQGGAASGGAGVGGSAGSGAAGSSGKAGASGNAGASGSSSSGFPYQLEFVGNITTGDGVDTDGKTFSRHWDQITPENAGKWGSVQSNAGAAFNWRTLDAIYDYTENAGIIFKEHAFVWGSQQPSGSLTEAHVKEWMTEFCRRYPNTKLIDVVNEPPPHTTPSYANAIGGGTNGNWQWITNSFIWARQACPNAILILNDYSNVEYQVDADNFLDIVKIIQAAGAPIDAVGAQAHDLDDQGMELETVQGFIERLHAETGLPLYITEMDIDQTDDQAQLRYYQDYFPYFRDSGYVKGLTIWGWIYGRTWSVAPNSGLVRNGQSRPAMTWLMEQLDRPIP